MTSKNKHWISTGLVVSAILVIMQTAKTVELQTLEKGRSHVKAKTDTINRELVQPVTAYTKRFTLVDLWNNPNSLGDSELRVWIGFGGLVPRCFVLRERGSLRKFFFLTETYKDGKRVLLERELNSPESDEFISYIAGLELTRRGWLKDTSHMPDPDEELIVLEMKTPEAQLLVGYAKNSTHTDGELLRKLINEIQRVFKNVI